MVNCNECANINLTEYEQLCEPCHTPHVCKIYNEKLLHKSRILDFHDELYPCAECENDGFKCFKRRKPLI